MVEHAAYPDLSLKEPFIDYGGEGGLYYSWSRATLLNRHPILVSSQKGAGKLILQKNGMALPGYSDSPKIAYVLKGKGLAGILLPGAEKEKVIAIRRGDAIAIPFGVVTWWFNPWPYTESEHLLILFLGDTSKAYKVGEFNDFYLTGTGGTFTGFSDEFVQRAWDLSAIDAYRMIHSRIHLRIAWLSDAENKDFPAPSDENRDGLVVNCEEMPLEIDVDGGGRKVVVSSRSLPLAKEFGFVGELVTLDADAMYSPGFYSDSACQVTYVTKGSGRVEVVTVDGYMLLGKEVCEGSFFVVPSFHVVSKIAGPEGMQWFSLLTTPEPVFTQLAGKGSVWKALSPGVIKACLKISAEQEEMFRSKRESEAVFFPPSN